MLLIIGLLVGGILVGRDLIHAAELGRDMHEVDKMNAAVNTFRLKYGCLPGDCANATQFLEGAYDGNGNGVIDTAYSEQAALNLGATPDGAFIRYEIAYAIDDLARGNLIPTPPFEADDEFSSIPTNLETVLPRLPYGKHFVVVPEIVWDALQGYILTGKHTFRLGVTSEVSAEVGTAYFGTIPPRYTPSDAYFIDNKTDDGKAISGHVTAGANDNAHGRCLDPISEIVGTGSCSTFGMTADCEYDLSLTDKSVGLFIEANF